MERLVHYAYFSLSLRTSTHCPDDLCVHLAFDGNSSAELFGAFQVATFLCHELTDNFIFASVISAQTADIFTEGRGKDRLLHSGWRKTGPETHFEVCNYA